MTSVDDVEHQGMVDRPDRPPDDLVYFHAAPEAPANGLLKRVELVDPRNFGLANDAHERPPSRIASSLLILSFITNFCSFPVTVIGNSSTNLK